MLVKITENVHMAFEALLNNKMRSMLTMLGITIGVASVILLMSVGQAVEKFVIGEFSSFGSNLVITFGKTNYEVTDKLTAEEVDLYTPLTEADYDNIRDPFNVPDAQVVAAAVAVTAPIEVNDEEYTPQIAGITESYIEAYNFTIGLGQQITDAHNESAARVAVIGQDVVRDAFDGAYPLGETLRIDGVNFEVIGVWDEIQSSLDPQINNIVILPMETVQRRLIRERTTDGGYPITAIYVKATDESTVNAVVEQVRTTMRNSHDLRPDEKDDFVVLSQNQLLETLGTVTSLLTVFLAVIAGISLLVGGIGIMNIMLVTVTERTREIGIRKAIGAHRSDILTQFLIESVTMSFVGGAIGTVIAISLSMLATALVPNLDVQVQASSILIAVIISAGVGTFFGAYPANRAASLHPIDALHHE
ncbi:MAG: ABC transporter permease [Chloroflexota bacterium]